MQKITTVAGLKDAIQALETEQKEKGRLLKDQLLLTYESLKPVNILKHTLNELFSTSQLIENLSGTSLGILIGYLIRKLFIRESRSKFRKIIASVFQLGISKLVEQKAEYIRAVGNVILQHLFRKAERTHQEQ
jgi:hypothetical protein